MAKKRGNVMRNDDQKVFAFLAVLLSILGFLIAFIAKRDDKYVMYYAKQSFVIFVYALITAIVAEILKFIIFGEILALIAWAVYIALWVIAMVHSLSGQMKETPLIGNYGKLINV